MGGRTVDELKLAYGDVKWRSRYLDICDLVEILGDCIIPDDFVVPDESNAAIKLTPAGNVVLDRLTRKEKVNAKDARLMCALTIGHDELFIDVDATDVDRLASAIQTEVFEGSIRFPYTWGRDLYDAYAELYEDEKDVLTNEETLRLLNKLPKGVVQYGSFTVGPYGLRRSLSHRSIPGRRRVAAYHCAVPTCQAIHPVALQTGQSATINRDRDKLELYLQGLTEEPADWWAFAEDLSGLSAAQYGDQRAGVLLPLIGDTLSDRELRALTSKALDSTRGELREAVSTFTTIGSAETATASMARSELLQICLVAAEDSLASAIDELVREGVIKVPRGDIRRPVINRNTRSGAFRLHAELGHHGVRFISDDPGLAILRERRLLNKLYLRDPESDVQELEWQLRGIDIEDLDEKLEHFFQTRAPQEALERLVLARKTNMITACHEVGIDSDSELPDSELVEALLWKLGFPTHTDEDPHRDFWRQHERLWALTQSSSIGNSERFLEAAGPYFTQLEGLIIDSLAFTSWALLVDHTRNDAPFAYDDYEDRAEGLALLQSAVGGAPAERPHAPDYTGERVELRNLIEGFRILAKHLETCRKNPEHYLRPTEEFPSYDGKTDLKRFILRSTVPFLDLSGPSQDRIVDGLKLIAQTMAEAEVHSVRNDYAHYRRTAPDISKIERALEAVRQSITRIENLGFCRLLFTPASVTTDRWGQSRHDFSGPRSYEHAFARPTTLDWMGLPSLTEPQYLLRAASFGDPNEVLRFTRRYDSEFSEMWTRYPRRRRSSPGTPSAEEQPSHDTDVDVAAG
ncbi:hypothetical protein [Microbacterium sp.]|uniref:hypothetical protein n=1 Tax=Microbacterium sp. TaxID=51671 RepID=UPI00391A5713